MDQKISQELVERIGQLRDQEAVRVIVTLKSGTNRDILNGTGIQVENVLESVPGVSGTVSVSGVAKLAQLDEVELVELDGEMHAL